MRDNPSNSDDLIDSRDIIARIEELEGERGNLEELREAVEEAQSDLDGLDDDASEEDREEAAEALADAVKELQDAEAWAEQNPDDAEELATLKAVADEGESYANDWTHGATLIRESHWVEYVEEMLKDIGDLPQDIPGYIAIDWEKTADNIRVDYTEIDFEGVTYLVR